MSAIGHCRRRGCGARLEERLDGIGRLTFVCPACDRNRRGLCRECPRPIDSPRQLRCRPCAKRVDRALDNARSRARYRDPVARERALAQKRERYRTDAEFRAKQLADNKRRRQEHARKRNDADRLYHNTWMRERRKDPVYRDRVNARRRERARERRAA